MKDREKIEEERHEIAEILARYVELNGAKWDACDFEWAAYCLQEEGYRKQSGWVSVEERFPEPYHRVIVYTSEGAITSDMAVSVRGKMTFLFENVTHWMPLPEPPTDVTDTNGHKQ